jgi:hypothetical protein
MGEPTEDAPIEPDPPGEDPPTTADAASFELGDREIAAPAAPVEPRNGGGAEAVPELGGTADAVAGERPSTAPGNARWDLQVYRSRATHFGRQAHRAGLAIIVVTGITAAVGAFTAVFDEAWLGVVTGILGAMIAGIESWRMVSKVDRKAAAYRAGYTEIESELDLFLNDGGAYSTIAEGVGDPRAAAGKKRAHLTERLVAINQAALSASA